MLLISVGSQQYAQFFFQACFFQSKLTQIFHQLVKIGKKWFKLEKILHLGTEVTKQLYNIS